MKHGTLGLFMAMYSPTNTPEQNFALLGENPYPGRLLIVGYAAGDVAVQAYALMGRSAGSQNRRLIDGGGVVFTEMADPTASVGDPELTIYPAMMSIGDSHIVSNGRQTTTAAEYLMDGRIFAAAMGATTYEPDAPTHTPRITAVQHLGATTGSLFEISVIRKSPHSNAPIHGLYNDVDLGYEPGQEVGFCVHTYNGDGDPLPPFAERPFRVPVLGNADEMAEMLWDNLNPQNRVAVAAKTITPDGIVEYAILNRHGSADEF